MNEDEHLDKQQQYKINQILRHQGTEFDWLLKQIEQHDSSDWANKIEITLIMFGGFSLYHFYDYSQQNELNMRYFIFALLFYIMAIAMRNLQKHTAVESRINLLVKALTGINKTLTTADENNHKN